MMDELVLNTKDCFLCSQTIPEADLNELCLRNICSFLQVNTSAVIAQGLLKKDQLKVPHLLQEDSNYNFSVNLCNPCHAVTGKLSSLIHDLEVAQLQVNYYCDEFEKILETTELTSAAATKKTEHVVTGVARVVENLRKTVKQKCSARDKNTLATCKLPLVRINKLTQKTGDAPSSSTGMVSGSLQINEDRQENRQYSSKFETNCFPLEAAVDPQSNDSQWTRDSTTIPPVNMKQILEDITANFCSEQSGTKICCGFCEQSRDKNRLNFHLTTMHPEKLFYFAKHSKISEEVFVESFHQTVLRETQKCNMLSTTISDGKMSVRKQSNYFCYICETFITERLRLRNHFVEDHADILVEKLHSLQNEKDWNSEAKRGYERDECGHPTDNVDTLALQETSNLEGNGSTKKTTNRRRKSSSLALYTGSQNRISCLHCKKSFTRTDKIRLHMLRSHPHQIFLSYKPNQQSLSQFSASCQKVFQTETVGYSDGKKHKASINQCAYCSMTHRYKISYLKHLVYSHTEILAKKINALEDEEDVPSPSYPEVKREKENWSPTGEDLVDQFEDPLARDRINNAEDMMVDTEDCNEKDMKPFLLLDESSNCTGAALNQGDTDI